MDDKWEEIWGCGGSSGVRLSWGQPLPRVLGCGRLWAGVQLCPTCSLVLPELPVLVQGTTSRDTEVLLGSLGGHSLCRLGCHGKEPPLLPRLVEGHREMTFHKTMGSFRLENPSKSLSTNP